MPEHVITEVGETTRQYKDNYGDKVVYYVRLENVVAETPNQAFELHKQATSKPPEPGHKLDVKRFDKGDHNGVPFVRIYQNFTERSGGSGGSGGSDNYDRRPEHPRNEARMIHTSALSAAPDYYRLMREENIIAKPEGQQEFWAALRAVAGELTLTYKSALAGLAGPATSPQVAAEVPADTEGLQPAAGGAQTDDDIPF